MPSEHEPRPSSDAGLPAASLSCGELPPDLAALAEQLSDDSARLAARYPAGARRAADYVTQSTHRPEIAWRRVHVRWAIAAAVLAVVSAGLAWRIARFDAPVAARPVQVADDAGVATDATPPATAVVSGREQPVVVDTPSAADRADARAALLAVEPSATNQPPAAAAARLPRDEAALLRVQIDAFAQVIERLQAELARRDELQRQTNESLQTLTAEVARLRKELDIQQAERDSP